jgi:hypothetical protein
MMFAQSCKVCFYSNERNKILFCRRNPPMTAPYYSLDKTTGEIKQGINTIVVSVDPSQWCGEFISKDSQKCDVCGQLPRKCDCEIWR